MKEKLKVIIKRPDEMYGHVTHISNKLENLQNNVGGYIEVVNLGRINGVNVLMICNEEGKIRNLPINIWINGDYIRGIIIILGGSGEEFTDIPIQFYEWKTYLESMEILSEIYANKKTSYNKERR